MTKHLKIMRQSYLLCTLNPILLKQLISFYLKEHQYLTQLLQLNFAIGKANA